MKSLKENLPNRKKLLVLLTLSLICIILLTSIYFLLIRKDFRITGLKDKELEVSEKAILQKPKFCYGSILKCHPLKYEKQGKVIYDKLGTYKIIYKLRYKNKQKNVSQTIKIVDKTKPIIEIADTPLIACPNGTPLNVVVKAHDNYDGDLTENIKIKINQNKITFTVEDTSKNKATITKFATIKDTEKPHITLNGKKIVKLKLGNNYTEQGATATDICDGDLTDKIKITNNINTNKKGNYYVNYEVKDKAQNKEVITRKVKITDYKKVIKQNGKTVYLTFDDGPGPDTKKLLDILDKYGIKATFFVTNKVSEYPEALKRAYQEGHTIGLHTWSHNYAIYRSKKSYFKDLSKIENKVYQLTGHKASIIRFPGGSSNTISMDYQNGIMSTLTKEVEKRGYTYFDWNVTSGDAGETTNTKTIYKNVIRGLKNNKTSIVLQHDIHTYSINAVENIIKYGLSHGYKFKKIDESTPVIHHRVNN